MLSCVMGRNSFPKVRTVLLLYHLCVFGSIDRLVVLTRIFILNQNEAIAFFGVFY